MATASPSGSEQKLQSTPSGIPQAPFIEDVESHLGGPDVPVQATLQKFQEALQKYKIMESSTFSRSKSLQEKIPDIEKTLAMVEHLKELREEGKGMETRFELHDTLYASAEIEPVDEVNLWLGANVMLSYPLEEAITLLSSKLSTAQKSLKSADSDLDFLRDQITTMEVNIARTHNWDVRRRREG
ncbi:Prefoldin, subunit 3 [Microstroma glucosiphilum]|uniref:Prefoldin subunit 3 n=1 Tax=Pseudomicrostroma glucosiphilum TaxID=1684307 RepID=A0A316UFN5_9BASI|nr:Prefoldin, subunit 3 [Pseudomicrostroma glucosiphilum]PWN24137.1 Prefoldin, subunit 3 [Pseudomicrostroma glucosiphilum]